jgi:hypothetical protein
MPTTESKGRSLALASLTGVLILADGAFAAIALIVRNVYRDGNLTRTESATFILLGASALIGIVILFLALIAFARGGRGLGTAKLASALAWLRLAAVIIAIAVIAIRLGNAAVVGLFETFGALLAVGDAIVALVVASVAMGRARHG